MAQKRGEPAGKIAARELEVARICGALRRAEELKMNAEPHKVNSMLEILDSPTTSPKPVQVGLLLGNGSRLKLNLGGKEDRERLDELLRFF